LVVFVVSLVAVIAWKREEIDVLGFNDMNSTNKCDET
jgi:hypothetical protein